MSMFDFITGGLDAQIVVQASVANLRCTLEVLNKASQFKFACDSFMSSVITNHKPCGCFLTHEKPVN